MLESFAASSGCTPEALHLNCQEWNIQEERRIYAWLPPKLCPPADPEEERSIFTPILPPVKMVTLHSP